MREFPRGRFERTTIGVARVRRSVVQPGWRCSISARPIAKAASRAAPRFRHRVSGVPRIDWDDRTEFDGRPGDVALLASDHGAWVVGDKPAVVVDFQGMIVYARQH